MGYRECITPLFQHLCCFTVILWAQFEGLLSMQSKASCDLFGTHFTDKIAYIHQDLDTTVLAGQYQNVAIESIVVLSGWVSVIFGLRMWKSCTKQLNSECHILSKHMPHPSWHLAQGDFQSISRINDLQDKTIPTVWKEAAVKTFLKKFSLDLPVNDWNNYWLMAIFLSERKGVVVAVYLQTFLGVRLVILTHFNSASVLILELNMP